MALHPTQPSITIQPVRQVYPATSRRRRNIEAAAFVAVWMVAGYLLPISSNGYLLLGVPLTVIFQVVVRRRPLRQLYSSNPTRARLDRSGVMVAGVLALVPGWYAVKVLATGDRTLLGWHLAALAGAACAAFALRATSVPEALRSAALPLAVGSSAFVLAYGLAHVATLTPVPVAAGLVALAKYSALYFPASFLLEEVTFRGALDAHVHHDGERGDRFSAIYVSVLWGVWHLPVSTGLPLHLLLVELVLVHVLLGVPLSIAWRRSRNLTGPALAHAVNDAVRNALMLGL